MTLKRFKTDRRLWFWISLVLFIIPWFISQGKGMAEDHPYQLWVYLFTTWNDSGEMEGAAIFIVLWSVLFGLPAIGIGWVLQCIVVMIKDGKNTNDSTLSG